MGKYLACLMGIGSAFLIAYLISDNTNGSFILCYTYTMICYFLPAIYINTYE